MELEEEQGKWRGGSSEKIKGNGRGREGDKGAKEVGEFEEVEEGSGRGQMQGLKWEGSKESNEAFGRVRGRGNSAGPAINNSTIDNDEEYDANENYDIDDNNSHSELMIEMITITIMTVIMIMMVK